MGCRVHVVKKQREYGNTEAFNWNYSEFYSMLTSLGCNVCSCDEDSYGHFAEMTTEDYRAALNILESLRDGKEPREDDLDTLDIESVDDFNEDHKSDVMEYIKTLGYGLEYLCEIMELFYEQRDQNSDWIQFEAW